MSRAVAFAVVWLVAAAVALGVAWRGVGIVGDQVTEDRPAALSAAEIRARAGTAGSISTTTSTAAAPTTSVPAGSPGSTPATGGVTATTAPPASTPATTATTTTAATPAPSPPAETRTYTLVGGSASLRFTSSGVTVLWANPNAGFEVEIEPENVNGVKVEFESETHRSRVDGWWDDGPQDRVREEDR